MPRALISVSDKKGIVEFAEGLVKLGYELISTGGTFDVLKKNRVAVTPIDQVTGFPEMMDGRVKTLHPKIHGGILALRTNPEHMEACYQHHIELIDLVVVNLYPFEKTVSNPSVQLEEAIENIDIGGPSMIRSAAKNFASVGVIVDPDRYSDILTELTANKGKLSDHTRMKLAQEAFEHTSRYDAIICGYLTRQLGPSTLFATVMSPILTKVMDLRYGENPHQEAALYQTAGHKGLPQFKQLHGKELSFNNFLDMQAAISIANEFNIPAAAVIKHTNPCGAATGDNSADAYQKAHDADPVSAFGSIVSLNRPVDKATATALAKTFVEVIIAPAFEKEALDILMRKPSLRLVTLEHFQSDTLKYHSVDGGFLVQSTDQILFNKDTLTHVTTRKPSAKEFNDLTFAAAIVKHVKSNAIVITKNGQTIGIGAGQMSRVKAVEIALQKAGSAAKGAVLSSDAFFPFKDSVELIAASGITAIIQPGGSKRDQESIDCCDTHNIAMVFTGVRHFKH